MTTAHIEFRPTPLPSTADAVRLEALRAVYQQALREYVRAPSDDTRHRCAHALTEYDRACALSVRHLA